MIRNTAPGLSSAVYGQLARRVPDVIDIVTIQTGPLARRSFACSLKAHQPYFLGNYEPELVAAFHDAIRPGDVVFDIGGHFGYSALVAATIVGPKGRVVVFEANPDNCNRLRENVALNPDLAARVTIEQLAVADKVGRARFDGQSTSGHLSTSGIDVLTVTVDHYVATHGIRPAVIKMDIEGGETAALPSLRGVLHDIRPVLLIEIHDEAAWRALRDVATGAHYQVQTLRKGQWQPNDGWNGRELYRATAS